MMVATTTTTTTTTTTKTTTTTTTTTTRKAILCYLSLLPSSMSLRTSWTELTTFSSRSQTWKQMTNKLKSKVKRAIITVLGWCSLCCSLRAICPAENGCFQKSLFSRFLEKYPHEGLLAGSAQDVRTPACRSRWLTDHTLSPSDVFTQVQKTY